MREHFTARDVLDRDPAGLRGEEVEDDEGAPVLEAEASGASPDKRSFREGSKLAEVPKLLRREGGVTVEELSATMNWLPHSTRAVLTGLRRRGVLVTRRKTPDSRASAYVVEGDSPAASGRA